jgi:hypothetical protein
MDYNPDVWHLVKMKTPKETIYKVLGGWYGGYTGADSWRMNSGITSYNESGKSISFIGYSGSAYNCHVDSEKLSALTLSIFEGFEKTVSMAENYSIELISYEDFKSEFNDE